MYGLIALCLLSWLLYVPVAWAGSTLSSVKERGFLRCGVREEAVGLQYITEAGEWAGFFPDYCRAVAAAVLGRANAVDFVPVESGNRFETLGSGAIDILSTTATWTLRRDTSLKLDWAGVLYYDGQGFLAHKSLGVKSLGEVGAATVCVQAAGTTSEKNLAEYSRINNNKIKVLTFESFEGRLSAFMQRRCDLLTSDRLQLIGILASRLANPGAYVLLPEIISKEPLGPVVRDDDPQWFDIAKWIIYVIIAAEEKDVTSANVADMRRSKDPEVRRMLGVDPGLGKSLGLDEAWAARVIEQVGNYGEIFERNLGKNTPLGLERGLNALWIHGGLMYAPPLR